MEFESVKKYVDVQNASARLMGNTQLYKKLLGSFLSGGHLDALHNSIAEGDPVVSARAVHTVKGLCANLSLPELYTASCELETLIKENADYTAAYETFNSAAKETVDSINLVIANL